MFSPFCSLVNCYFCEMAKIKVKILNKSTNPLPAYVTEGSAGMDIRADLRESIVLKPLQRMLIATGLFLELPEDYEAQIRPRSGLAVKQGITCLNSPGTIDADYRGEIKIILINFSNEEHTIAHGDRIAQMIVAKVEKVEWKITQEISVTARNKGGFGHTGK